MRQKTKITKVYISDKDKHGKAFLDKNNKPFWKVAIQTVATGKEYYSALAFRDTDAIMKLKEGDERLFDFEEKDGFKNFTIPSRLDLLEDEIAELKKVVNQLLTDKGKGYTYPTKTTDKDEINPEDIPFR